MNKKRNIEEEEEEKNLFIMFCSFVQICGKSITKTCICSLRFNDTMIYKFNKLWSSISVFNLEG
jgi:hypothetical protein